MLSLAAVVVFDVGVGVCQDDTDVVSERSLRKVVTELSPGFVKLRGAVGVLAKVNNVLVRLVARSKVTQLLEVGWM